MKSILIIHPDDKSTLFLNRIKSNLRNEHEDIIHFYNVKPNNLSHNKCVNLALSNEKFKFIVFFGHGKNDKLCGSKGKFYDSIDFKNDLLFYENPQDYFYKESFIDNTNVSLFKNKNIFCLSCNSNDKIANYAIEAGANSFIGFGNIPTSIEEFKELKYRNVSTDLVRSMKTEINYIVKKSLNLAIKNNSTVEQLGNYIEFISNQRIADILINQKKYKDRFTLTDNIYLFKKEMKIFGNKKSNILTSA